MIGEQIQRLRKEKNLSLRALAEKSNLSKSTLSDIENGNTNPTTNTLSKIATALNISVENLFSSQTVMYNNPNNHKKDTALNKTKFETMEDVLQFILNQDIVINDLYLENISDQDKEDFANEIYIIMKMIAPKYRHKNNIER